MLTPRRLRALPLLSASALLALAGCGASTGPASRGASSATEVATDPTTGAATTSPRARRRAAAGESSAVAVRLGCEAITEREVERERARAARMTGQDVPREAIVDALVQRRLVERDARRLELTVSDDDVERAIASVRAQADLTPERFEAALAERGLTLEVYRAEIRGMLLSMRVAQTVARPVITREEVERIYAERVGEEGPFEDDELAEVYQELERERMQALLSARYGRMRRILETARTRRTSGSEEAEGAAEGGPRCTEQLPEIQLEDVRVEGLSVLSTGTVRGWLEADADASGRLALDEAGELRGGALQRLAAALYDEGLLTSSIAQRYEDGGALHIVVTEGHVHHVGPASAFVRLADGTEEPIASPVAPTRGSVLVRSELSRWVEDVARRAAERLGVPESRLVVTPATSIDARHEVSIRIEATTRDGGHG